MGTDLTVMITGESGTGKELVAARAARLRQAPRRAVRRRQHGGDPARADRERAVRPREGRLHRRQHPQRRPLRAGARAARCSSTRSATCRSRRRPGCCACCRRASSLPVGGRTPDPRRRAHRRRDPPRPAPAGPPGPVPRGPVLPPQRRADPPAAAARAGRGHPGAGPRTSSPRRRPTGLPPRRSTPEAMDRLKRHRWPGNVRELENLVRRLAALYPQETIGARGDRGRAGRGGAAAAWPTAPAEASA